MWSKEGASHHTPYLAATHHTPYLAVTAQAIQSRQRKKLSAAISSRAGTNIFIVDVS